MTEKEKEKARKAYADKQKKKKTSTKKKSSKKDKDSEYVYDVKKRKWVKKSSKKSKTKSSTTDTKSVSGATSTSDLDSQSDAEKDYIEMEFNTLEGDISLVPTDKTLRIKECQTIKLLGVGQYLSGVYYVSAVQKTIDADNGFSQSATLIKTGFGTSLKRAQTPTYSSSVPQTNSIQVNDSVRIVGDNAIYSNASQGVKVPAWVKKKTLTVQQISSDGARARVQPINSWTYLKFLQKV